MGRLRREGRDGIGWERKYIREGKEEKKKRKRKRDRDSSPVLSQTECRTFLCLSHLLHLLC